MTIGHNNFLLTSVVEIWETQILASGQGAQSSYSCSPPKKIYLNLKHLPLSATERKHKENRIVVLTSWSTFRLTTCCIDESSLVCLCEWLGLVFAKQTVANLKKNKMTRSSSTATINKETVANCPTAAFLHGFPDDYFLRLLLIGLKNRTV